MLGKPDLAIAGLKIWVHGRESENPTDYWDGNWLHITANRAHKGASVTSSGSILHLSEVAHLLKECEAMNDTVAGSAAPPCMEPELEVKLVAGDHGAVEATIQITPDHLTQRHSFTFEIDQSYLPAIIAGCRHVLEKYPVRGERDDRR